MDLQSTQPVKPSSPTVQQGQTSGAKRRRATAAAVDDCCRTCRLRKVKCSGNPGQGPCANCARLELRCAFQDSEISGSLENIARNTPSQSHTEAGTLRKRAQRACKECHSHKTKCSGDLPICSRCQIAGLACEYATSAKRKSFKAVVDDGHGESSSEASQMQQQQQQQQQQSELPPKLEKHDSDDAVIPPLAAPGAPRAYALVDLTDLTGEHELGVRHILKTHFDAYMENLYYTPCLGFLHPRQTLNAIESGTLSPPKSAALCAITSFFINPGPAGKDFGARCADRVELYIWRTINKFSEETLILLALNMTCDFLNGAFAKIWQSIGVGARLMLGLQVNWDIHPANRSFAEQETIRRAAWHFFTLDRMLSGGFEEYISCRAEFMKIRLPCEDTAYAEDRAVQAPRLDDKGGEAKEAIGLSGHAIRLIDIRHRIQVYFRSLSMPGTRSRAKWESSAVMGKINDFQCELSRIHGCLPPTLWLSDENIAAYMASPQRSGYVYLHTHIFATIIELYRFALPGFQDQQSTQMMQKLPRDFLLNCQKQAIAHAICLAKFCDAIQREADKMPQQLNFAGDSSISHIATQALRVLLIALQHRLYQDLSLAEHSTAPLWRNEPTTAVHLRSLIDCLFKVTEPWVDILVTARHAHDNNKKMVEQYDQMQAACSQPDSSTSDQAGPRPGLSRFARTHCVLDAMQMHANANDEQERRSRAGDAAAATSWQRWGPQNPAMPVGFPVFSQPAGIPPEGSEYGSPGVPMLLAHARGVSFGASDPNMYAVEDSLQALQRSVWPMPDLGSLIGAPPMMAQEELPFIHMPVPQVSASDPSTLPPIPGPTSFGAHSSDVFGQPYVDSYHASNGNVPFPSQPPFA